MPTPPAESLDPKGRTEDYNDIFQQVLDETDSENKKDRPKKRKKPDNKIHHWHYYYHRPKWKDFEPSQKLADKISSAPPPPPRRFREVTPGEMILKLVREAHARGAIPEVRCDFDARVDSAGRKWGKKPEELVSHKFEPKTTLLQAVHWLAESNHAEARMNGRILQLFRPDSGKDHPDVMLAPGKNVLDNPSQGTFRDLSTHLFVVSESGVHGWVGDHDLRRRVGRRVESGMDVGPMKEWEKVEAAGQRRLDRQGGRPHHPRVVGVIPDRGANPYRQYKIGDTIRFLDNGTPTKHRVRQIQLSWETDDSCVISVSLTDKIIPHEVKRHKRDRAVRGKTAMTSPSLSQLSRMPPGSDGEAPAPPSAPSVSVKAGTAELGWDGLDEEGLIPVWDQDHVELHIGTEEGYTPDDKTLFHNFGRAAGVVTVNFPDYDFPYYAKMIAVDEGGDRSAPGEEVVVRVPKIQADDLGAGVVGPEQLDPNLGIGTDGLSPSTAPTGLVVTGLVEQAMLSWTAPANADPLTYRVHIATTNASAPSSLTVHHELSSTKTAIATLPDGSKLVRDTTYYAAIEARDADVSDAAVGPYTAWVAFSIIEQIESTQISDGAIQTPQLAANAVIADKIAAGQISAAHLEAVMVLASEIWAGGSSGQRAGLTGDGIWAYDSANNAKLAMPINSDAFQLNADVIMQTATALAGIMLQGVSQLAVGSAIEMQSAYKAPASPPTAQITWPLTPLASDVFPTGKRGLFWDATTSHWFYAVANGVGFDSTIEEVTTAGVSVASYPIKQVGGTLPIDANGGVVKIGTTWYVLGRDHLGDYQVFRFTSLTAAVNNNAAGNWAYTNDPLGLRPALGTDGTDIIIARTNGSDNVVVRHFGPTTGTNSLTVTSSNTPGNRNLAGVLLLGTSAGFAANRYVVAPVDSGTLQGAAEGNILVYTTGGTYQSDDVFPVAYGATLAGLGWNGTDIIQLSIGTEENSTGKLARYLTGNNWTTQSARYEVSFTRRDGVGTAHETNDSPVTVITMKKRARLRVSCAAGLLSSPGVDDPDRVRIYIGRGSGGSVTDATRWRQTEPAAGITTVDLDAIVFSGNNLTARDAAFGDSTHAELRTSDGIPLLRANGTVRCRLVKGTVSTANNTDASVGWDSEDIDTDNFWSSGAASVITVPYSGQYHVAFHGVWAANGTGRRALFMESSSDGGTNWSLMPALQDRRMAVGGGDVTINEISQIASLVTGNQYRVRRNQDSTAALNLNQARFSIEFKGPS